MRSGQKKTSANNEAIRKMCEEMDYDPLKALIELTKETRQVSLPSGEIAEIHVLEPRERIAIAREVAGYLHSKYKGVDLPSEKKDDKITIVIEKKTDGIVPSREEPTAPSVDTTVILDHARN